MAAAKKIVKKSIVKDTRKAHRVGKNSKKLVTTSDVHAAREALQEFEKSLNCDRSIVRALNATKTPKEFNALCIEHDLHASDGRTLVRLWAESRDLHLQYREDVKVRAKSK